MKHKLSAAVFASLCVLVACGLLAVPATAKTVTSASFGLNAGDVANGVDVQLKEESGDRVVASATTDAAGKFTFPDLPDGKYRLTLTFPGKQDTSGDTPKPTVRTFLLTVTGVRGEPLKKDLDLKAEQPMSTILKKLPGKRTPPTITLKRGSQLSRQYTVAGIILLN
jgi:hypothetical protein